MINAVKTNFDGLVFYGWLLLMALVFLLSGTML